MNEKSAFEGSNLGALTAIDELRLDSKIGKSKHFNASDRKLFWHRFFGVPVIVANLFVGIVLVSLQGSQAPSAVPFVISSKPIISEERPVVSVAVVEPIGSNSHLTPSVATKQNSAHDENRWSTENLLGLFSIFLAFGAASLSAVQTFFNFHKASEGHRSIGNRYVHISRQCKGLQQKHRDVPYAPEALWVEYDLLYAEYHQINTEAEAFPTNSDDLNKAKGAAEISPYKVPHR
jgi:hypothetical protein